MRKKYIMNKLIIIIIQKRIEDQKQKEKQKTQKFRFKAKELPSTTKELLYQQMLENEETQRISRHETCKRELEEMLQPFEGMQQRYGDQTDRKEQLKKKYNEELQKEFVPFKANKVDPRVFKIENGDIKKMLEEENQKRIERVNKRAIWLYQNSHLPPRMEMWKLAKDEEFKETEAEAREKEESLKKYVRDKKRKVGITKPKPFNFDNPDSDRYKELEYLKKTIKERQIIRHEREEREAIEEAEQIKAYREKVMKQNLEIIPKTTNASRLIADTVAVYICYYYYYYFI